MWSREPRPLGRVKWLRTALKSGKPHVQILYVIVQLCDTETMSLSKSLLNGKWALQLSTFQGWQETRGKPCKTSSLAASLVKHSMTRKITVIIMIITNSQNQSHTQPLNSELGSLFHASR